MDADRLIRAAHLAGNAATFRGQHAGDTYWRARVQSLEQSLRRAFTEIESLREERDMLEGVLLERGPELISGDCEIEDVVG